MFLNLSVVEVGSPDSQFDAHNEKECREECLNNCQCQAYSYEEVDTKCWIWLEDLNNLKEGYSVGSRYIFIRVAVPDIGNQSLMAFKMALGYKILVCLISVEFRRDDE